MNIEEKIWNFVGTGLKLHAFVGGRALCRSSYKETAPEGNKDYCEAKTYAQKQHGGVAVCGTCETKFNAAIERLEASMALSTGEGDYLPPAAEQAETTPAQVSDRMRDDLMMAANTFQNAYGVVCYSGRRTEDALMRRGLITYDVTHNNYPVITVKGWEYLASQGFNRRAEDPGRLKLEQALAEAYSAPAAEQVETVAPVERVRTEDLVPGDRVWGDRTFIEVRQAPEVLTVNPWNTGVAMRVTGVDFAGNPETLDALASKMWIRERSSTAECVCPPSYAANDHHDTWCPQAPLDPDYAEALAMNAAYDEQVTPQELGDMAAAASAAVDSMHEAFRSLAENAARSLATLQTPTQKLLSEIQVRPEILREQLDTLRREQLEDRALLRRLMRFASAHITNPEMKRVYATISAHNLGEQYQPDRVQLDSYVIPPGY